MANNPKVKTWQCKANLNFKYFIHEGDTIDLIKKISIVGDELVIDWNDGNKSSLFSYWLRDHCQMPESRNENNGQRLFSVKDLPEDVSIEKAYKDENGDVCMLFQPENHLSVFTQDWLLSNCYDLNDHFEDRSEKQKKLWQKNSFEAGLPFINYDSIDKSDTQLSSLRSLREIGFFVIKGVPNVEGQVLKVISKMGYTRETNYGALFEVRTEVNPNNLAYTNLGLGSHTDNPYRDPVPTVQLLHCLESSTEGGDSILVDGFKAASILRDESKENFLTLTSSWINYRFTDSKTDLRSRVPMIELNDNNEIIKVRYNNRSIDTIKVPKDKMRSFYKAYRHWSEVIERDELKIQFRLSEGDLMLFDNTRVMHARTKFSKTGKRHLQGAYSDLDGLYSLLNTLEGKNK